MTQPTENVVGQMIAYGELELTPAALRQSAGAQQHHTDQVDAEQKDK